MGKGWQNNPNTSPHSCIAVKARPWPNGDFSYWLENEGALCQKREASELLYWSRFSEWTIPVWSSDFAVLAEWSLRKMYSPKSHQGFWQRENHNGYSLKIEKERERKKIYCWNLSKTWNNEKDEKENSGWIIHAASVFFPPQLDDNAEFAPHLNVIHFA